MMLLGFLVIGLGAWGLTQSILATEDVIGEFWSLMDSTTNFVSAAAF